MELIKCAECIWGNNCPCGWSYCNAACLTIQQQLKEQKMKDGIYIEVFAVKDNLRYNYKIMSLSELTQEAAKGVVDGIVNAVGMKEGENNG